jgi:uncharacterized protein (DUF58 family)
MLYPNFHDLVALKNQKSKLKHLSSHAVNSTVPGNHHSPFRGQGLEFDSVREYVPGDDIRSIDWRVTARTGLPHLKLFKEERERHTILCVDMNASMRFGTRNTFKSVQAARAAAFLGWRGLAQHDCISGCLFGDVPDGLQFFAPKRTRNSFCTMLKMLAEPFKEQHFISLDELFKHVHRTSHTGALIYVISDFMDLNRNIQQEAVLSRINKRCDVVFIAINDQADQSIYPVGSIGFCANHGEKITVNTDSIHGRKAYANAWKENRQLLTQITSKFKIPLIALTTESDINRDLTMGLKTIAKRKTKCNRY